MMQHVQKNGFVDIFCRQFRRAVTLMVVAKLMVCYFPIHFTMIKKIQSRQFSLYLGPQYIAYVSSKKNFKGIFLLLPFAFRFAGMHLR